MTRSGPPKRDRAGYAIDTYVCLQPQEHEAERGAKPRRKFFRNPYIPRKEA